MAQKKDEITGKCALCHEMKPLEDSHLLPKWVYRHLGLENGQASNPIHVENGVASYEALVVPSIASNASVNVMATSPN